jgi:hypothetical protein
MTWFRRNNGVIISIYFHEFGTNHGLFLSRDIIVLLASRGLQKPQNLNPYTDVGLWVVTPCGTVGTLCTTKTKRLKCSKPQTGSDVSVQLAS